MPYTFSGRTGRPPRHIYYPFPGWGAVRRSTTFALLSITLLSVYLRLVPVMQYLYWGSDFGEYYGVTLTLSQGSHLPDPYLGWGVTYPEFPGLHVLVAAASWAGLDLEAAAVLVVPVLAALVVIPVFLIAREVAGADGPALFAATLVAVAMPHVYTTSHAIPGALGDLLFASSLLLVLRLREDGRLFLLLIPLSLALVVIHHLSSYFLIIVTFMVIFLRVFLRGVPFAEVRRETGFLTFLVAVNLAFWGLFTHRFREFLGFERVPWWVTAVLLLALPLAIPLLTLLRQRLSWRYRPSIRPPTRSWKLYLASVVLGFVVLSALLFAAAPGTTILVTPEFLLFAAPLVPLFMLATPGRRLFDFLPGGILLTAAFSALLISWVIGATIAPTFLIPYRHLEYIAVVAAIFAGVGVASLLRVCPPRWRRGAIVVILTLLVLSAATALPPRQAVGNHMEGVRAQEVNAVQWAGQRIWGITASDHRVSSMLFGFTGQRATWDLASLTLTAPTFEMARSEMAWVEDLPGGPGRVDFVLLDEDLIAGPTFLPWDPAIPMSEQALGKFLGGNYLKLYDDGYSQVYWVNWGTA